MIGVGDGALRRPVQERAWLTRARLIRATVDSLAEDGYAATTLGNVGVRSGVSRGSLSHQFPARQVLISAAMEEVTKALCADMLERRSHGHVDVATAVDIMWRHYDLPEFGAATEVMVAGRTDQSLIPAIDHFLANVVPTANQTLLTLLGQAEGPHPSVLRMCAVLLDSMTLVAQSHDFSLAERKSDPHLTLWNEYVSDMLDMFK